VGACLLNLVYDLALSQYEFSYRNSNTVTAPLIS